VLLPEAFCSPSREKIHPAQVRVLHMRWALEPHPADSSSALSYALAESSSEHKRGQEMTGHQPRNSWYLRGASHSSVVFVLDIYVCARAERRVALRTGAGSWGRVAALAKKLNALQEGEYKFREKRNPASCSVEEQPAQRNLLLKLPRTLCIRSRTPRRATRSPSPPTAVIPSLWPGDGSWFSLGTSS